MKWLKPKMIEVIHAAVSYYEVRDIERDLGIKWEDVESYHVGWSFLSLTMEGGQKLQLDLHKKHDPILRNMPYHVSELFFDQAGTATRQTIQYQNLHWTIRPSHGYYYRMPTSGMTRFRAESCKKQYRG